MNFVDSICRHLDQYRTGTLGVEDAGTFSYRGKVIPKGHILPRLHRTLNILPEYRSQFLASDHGRISFHDLFHHLNSSQALCINLFYPLVAESELHLVADFLELPATSQLESRFEKKSDLEKAVRLTSFDFFLQSGPESVFFEVKYTENGFGKATADGDHKDKFKATYKTLVNNSEFLTEACREESFFLEHYQILRNLVHITSTSYVVFLFPSANTTVKRQADKARADFLTDAGRKRMKIVFLEDLVAFLEGHTKHQHLARYYGHFRGKYLPTSVFRADAAQADTALRRNTSRSE